MLDLGTLSSSGQCFIGGQARTQIIADQRCAFLKFCTFVTKNIKKEHNFSIETQIAPLAEVSVTPYFKKTNTLKLKKISPKNPVLGITWNSSMV
jgi:hypothetical protein